MYKSLGFQSQLLREGYPRVECHPIACDDSSIRKVFILHVSGLSPNVSDDAAS